MSDTNNSWPEANQRYLMARLRAVRLALESHSQRAAIRNSAVARDPEPPEEDLAAALMRIDESAAELPAPAALDHLCEAFSLSPFERDLLLLCAGVELEGTFPAVCAAAQGDARRNYATLSLALAALSEPHWNALTPTAPLRRWRLIEIAHNAESLMQSQLRIDERVLHYLAGVSYLDERLKGLVESYVPKHDLAPSQRRLAERIAEFWALEKDAAVWPFALLSGTDHAGKRAVAGYACALLGLRLHVMPAVDVPSSIAERQAFVRLWEREAALLRGALLLEQNEQAISAPALNLIDQLHGVLFVAVPETLKQRDRVFIHVKVEKPTPVEQQSLWLEALGPEANLVNGQVERLVSQFSLGREDILAVTAQARDSFANEGATMLASVWNACRALARPRLDDLAQRIAPAATWNDLVLPGLQRRALGDIAAHVRQRVKVYEKWGFAGKGERGLGISALFAGASGTGKTMAAEVLANDLQLDLYRIDLSQVVSKYIGETEKNLRRVFEAAEEGCAVLLFDEADALFGKRSEVKDSHDRYANIEVSYLLQRMEAYRGLAILTTNLKSAVDSAFLRRLRFVVQFPFPDAALRAEIWRRIFPAETPTTNINYERLARLSIPGGNIRNIALNAAFFAADASESVTMTHLLRATRGEYSKIEKPLSESEIGGWL